MSMSMAETTTTTRESLINQLQIIWDELGECACQRAKMLSELGECDCQRAKMLSESEEEQQCLDRYKTMLDQMRLEKDERERQFYYVRERIRTLSGRSTTCVDVDDESETNLSVGLGDLNRLRKQLHSLTDNIRNRLSGIIETLLPLREVLGYGPYDLSYEHIQDGIDPFYFGDDISLWDMKYIEDTFEKLTRSMHEFQELKKQNMNKLQGLATTMSELWDCLGTPDEERQLFQNVTRRQAAASEHQITEPDILSSHFLNYVETEVSRLQALKSSRCGKTESVKVDAEDGRKRPERNPSPSYLKDLATTMLKLWDSLGTPNEERQLFHLDCRFVDASEFEITKDVAPLRSLDSLEAECRRLEQLRKSRLKRDVLKKKLECEKICKEADMVAESYYDQWDEDIYRMDEGDVDPQYLLDRLDRLIITAEKVRSGNDILNSVKVWLLAREEVSRAEEARAEITRALAIQLPEMVKELDSKATCWEKKFGDDLTYDGIRVGSLLKEPAILKRKREPISDQHVLDGLVIEYLQQPSCVFSKTSGASTYDISQKLKVPMGKLYESLQSLEAEGLIYSTIDDFHYKMV